MRAIIAGIDLTDREREREREGEWWSKVDRERERQKSASKRPTSKWAECSVLDRIECVRGMRSYRDDALRTHLIRVRKTSEREESVIRELILGLRQIAHRRDQSRAF